MGPVEPMGHSSRSYENQVVLSSSRPRRPEQQQQHVDAVHLLQEVAQVLNLEAASWSTARRSSSLDRTSAPLPLRKAVAA